MKTLVFRGFHKANVEKHMGFEALNGNPGPKHCVLPHFLGGGGRGASWKGLAASHPAISNRFPETRGAFSEASRL